MVRYNKKLGGVKITEKEFDSMKQREDENGEKFFVIPYERAKPATFEKMHIMRDLVNLNKEGKKKADLAKEMGISLATLNGYLYRTYKTSDVLKIIGKKSF